MLNSSTFYINNIDQNYPSIEKDNSSQPFRSNFKNIKEGLKNLNNDTIDIFNNVIVSSKEINDFKNNIIKRPKFKQLNKKIYNETNIIQLDDFVINFKNGYYQKFVIDSGTHNISLINFPEEKNAGSIILELTTNSTFKSSITFDKELISFEKIIFPLVLEGENPHLFKIVNENNNFYFFNIKENNNFNSPVNLKTYNNTTEITEINTGSVVFISSNINKVAFNTGTQWFYIQGTKLSVENASTILAISTLQLTKNILMTPATPVTGNSGYQPIVYSITPELPTGLSFNINTGEITGTPSIELSSTVYTVSISDAVGNSSLKSFNLSVVN